MKIAFVIGSLKRGGAERVVSILASQMAKQGHDVSVLLLATTEKGYDLDEKVRIEDCSRKFSIKGLGFLQRVHLLHNALKRTGAEICVSFTVAVNLYAALACMGLKCCLVLAERNDPRVDPAGKVSRFLRRLLYPLADSYVFQTEGEKVFFSRRIQAKSIVIPNPINPEIPEAFDGQREKRIVAAARLYPQKNLKMAIDAFALIEHKYPEFSFEIYGRGVQEEELKQYILSLGIQDRVHLMGETSQLYEAIAKAYIFVLPSNYEGMSNSLLEAMALGLPVISTDHPSGGASAVITHGQTGFLVPVGGTQEMAQAMEQLIENPELARRIGHECQYVRKALHVDVIIEKWMDFLIRQRDV